MGPGWKSPPMPPHGRANDAQSDAPGTMLHVSSIAVHATQQECIILLHDLEVVDREHGRLQTPRRPAAESVRLRCHSCCRDNMAKRILPFTAKPSTAAADIAASPALLATSLRSSFCCGADPVPWVRLRQVRASCFSGRPNLPPSAASCLNTALNHPLCYARPLLHSRLSRSSLHIGSPMPGFIRGSRAATVRSKV
jgi:hypothetical protein